MPLDAIPLDAMSVEGRSRASTASTRTPVARAALAGLGIAIGLATTVSSVHAVPRTREQQAPEPTFAELELLLADPAAPLTDVSVSDGETTPDPEPDPLLDRLGMDLPCGTVLTRAADRILERTEGPRRGELQLLLLGPRLSAPREQPVAAEAMVLRFETGVGSRHAISRRDVDRDQVPDQIAGLADDLHLAASRVAEALGWSRRFSGTDGNLQVVIGGSAFIEGAYIPGSSPQLVLPRHAAGPARLAALTHQLAHAALDEIERDLPASFEEAVATLLAASVPSDGAWPNPTELMPELPAQRALLSPGLLASRGDAAFLAWVGHNHALPASWLADATALAARRLDMEREAALGVSRAAARTAVLDALDEVLLAAGSSLPEAVGAFQAWALEQDLQREDTRVAVDEDLTALPDETSRTGRDLPPLGQLRFGIEAPPLGGIALGFEGEDRVEATAFAMLADGSVHRFPLDAARSSLPDAKLAGGGLRRLVVLVSSPYVPLDWQPWEPGATEEAPGELTLSASVDASFPFVLSTISTEARAGQVTLDWDTSSEEDIVGWLVERASRPGGPYVLACAVPVPAQSQPGVAAGYAFVDAGVRPSARYHYRVVAVTSSGLTEVSPVVSLRTLPPAMSPDEP